MRKLLSNRSTLSAVATLVLALVLPFGVGAATLEVNQLADIADPQPDDGICDVDLLTAGLQCTLRAAVQTANALPGRDSVELQLGGVYQLNLVGSGLAAGDIDITEEIDIVGYVGTPPANTSDLPLIDALGLGDRAFDTLPNIGVLLRGLRIRGGHAEPAAGGGIRAHGPLTVEHCVFDYNVGQYGGAIFIGGGEGARVIVDSHFERNRSVQSGASMYAASDGTLEIIRSSFADNRGNDVDGASIEVGGIMPTSIANSTIDGDILSPPVAGFGNVVGVRAQGPQNLVVRNATINGFSGSALEMGATDPEDLEVPFVRVANSIIAGGANSCVWMGDTAQNVLMAYNLITSESGCAQYAVQTQVVMPDIGMLQPDEGRVTWSHATGGVWSNIVDAGIPADRPPPSPELACTSEDQRGNPRPQDGNGDDIATCDQGAVEEGEPLTFVVNIEGDEVDDVPGDGVCETPPIIGIPVPCSMRAAIMEANAHAGVERITFADGLGTLSLILPASPSASGGDLDITESVIINGLLSGGLPLTHVLQTISAERIFDINLTGDDPVVMRNLRISGGESGVAFGGGIRMVDGVLMLVRSELFDNSSPNAGGAIATHAGTLLVRDSDLHHNSSDGRGAAIFAGSTGVAAIVTSSVRGNQGDDGVGPVAAIEGEGGSGVAVVASTIVGNAAGIAIENPDFAMVANNTIVDNDGAGIEVDLNPGEEIGVGMNIIFGNGGVAGADCVFPGDTADVYSSYNLDGDGSCALGDASNVTDDPLLEPLAPASGHPSWFMMPTWTADGSVLSPAIDVGLDSYCQSGDQLGRTRPVDIDNVPNLDGSCDLGAVEVQSAAIFADGLE